MAATDYDQMSIGDLGRRLASTASALVDAQILLAKQEAREEVREGIRIGIWLGAGAGLLLFAVICLLIALTTGTAQALGWPIWVMAIIWLVIFAAAGVACLLVGRKRIQAMQPLGRTRTTLKEDLEWARQRLKPQER